MDIQTKSMGTVAVEEKQLLFFPAGLLGFEKCRRFALLDAEQKPFLWLQSLDEKELAFLLIDPFLFRSDYEPDVDDVTLRCIALDSPSDVVILSIVTIPHEGGSITANLLGPVIINKKNNQAAQAILSDSRWQIKHDIVAEIKTRNRSC